MKKLQKAMIVPLLLLLLFAAVFALALALPRQTYSEAERRPLQAAPTLTASSVLSGRFMSDLESFALDHFPLREALRSLKAAVQLDLLRERDANGLYRAKGHLAKLDATLDEASLDYAAARFASVAERYLEASRARVYFAVVPDKNRYLAPAAGYPALDYAALDARLRAALPELSFVELADLLELDDYYRTDPHWRQERLEDVAERLLAAMDAPAALSYTPQTLTEDFRGVYASQLPLPVEPDALTVLQNDVFARCTVTDWEHERTIPVYDAALATGRDPYETYLSGALSLVTIENPEGAAGRELIVFRDSFGSALAPLLIGGYEKITLVDIRYLSPDALGRFLDFHGQDVLFLYSTLVLNNSETLK